MAIQEAEISDNEEESDMKEDNKKEKKHCSKRILHSVNWEEKSTEKYKQNECYYTAKVGKIHSYLLIKVFFKNLHF